MATGPTGSARTYPAPGNSSNKSDWNDGPGGRSYPDKGITASEGNSHTTKGYQDPMPPGPAKPTGACNSEYRQVRSERTYSK